MADAVTLVLGGARSGKSRYAEARLAGHRGPRIYLATAEAGDAEMAARIAAHRRRRGTDWRTLEEPLELAATLALSSTPRTAILVDCLTLWLANLMHAGRDPGDETERLVQVLSELTCTVVMVSNEVGLGIVPANAEARRFRDAAGDLHQAVSAIAAEVTFVAAGIPLVLKPQRREKR